MHQFRASELPLAPNEAVDAVIAGLKRARDRALAAQILPERIWLDPGLGFGKDTRTNLAILAHLHRLTALGHPLVVGPSRKRFLGALTGQPPLGRDRATAAACAIAAAQGAAVLRVHDVAGIRDALAVGGAVAAARAGGLSQSTKNVNV